MSQKIIIHYINPLKQYGKISYEMLVELDETGLLTIARVSKRFPDTITTDKIIENTINNILSLYEFIEPPSIEVIVDEASD